MGRGCYISVNDHNILVFAHSGGLSPLRKQMETAHNCDWLELSARLDASMTAIEVAGRICAQQPYENCADM
jgi:hypothetical protein